MVWQEKCEPVADAANMSISLEMNYRPPKERPFLEGHVIFQPPVLRGYASFPRGIWQKN